MFEQIEKIRKEEVKKFSVVFALVSALTLFVVLCLPSDEKPFGILFGFIVDVVVICLVHQHVKKKFVQAYKELFLKEMLEKEFDDLRVDFERGLSEETIREGHLVALYDRFYSDDYVSGKLHGIPFECSDVKVQDVVSTGKSTTVVTRFQGLYLILPLKKSFLGWMVVREKELLDNGNPRGWFSEMPELQKIQVEDEVFNQKFSIYASDGTEAFYLLTPRMLEEIKKIEACYEGRCLFGFLNGQLHVAIDSRQEYFEVSLFESVDELTIREHETEIRMIKGLIELVAKECEEA